MSAAALHITNQNFKEAGMFSRGKHERAIGLAHGVLRVLHAIGRRHGLLGGFPLTRLDLLQFATGELDWNGFIGIDLNALDAAIKDCDELIDIVGEGGTVEAENEQQSPAMLKEQLLGWARVLAPLRDLVEPK